MGLERLVVPIEWKATDDDQTLDGYASTFGNVDLGGDVVLKGAFAKTVANINSNGIPLLADHVASTASVLGTIYQAKEDEHGLRIKARFSKAPSAQDVRVKLLEGHLNKMSIGYEVMEDGFEDRDGRRVRALKEVKLWETSVVVFPMNPEAAVSHVKSMVESLDEDERKQLSDALAPPEDKATHNETREALYKAVREYHKGTGEYAFVRDFDDSKVWYEVYSSKSGTESVFERGYEMDDNAAVKLDTGATEVRAVVQYVPLDQPEAKGITLLLGATKNPPALDGPGNAEGDEPEAKAADPAAPAGDDPAALPDEGGPGWDQTRWSSKALLEGRDPDATADSAKRAGLAQKLELMEDDVNRSRDLLSTSALQAFEPTNKEKDDGSPAA